MKLEHIVRAVYSEPWLITPSAHSAIRSIMESRVLGTPMAERKPGMGICGEEVEVEQMTVDDNGIAHIPIGGVMARGLSAFERGSGVVDTEDVLNDIDEAEEDGEVAGIILHIDSPGGTVNGTVELAGAVAAIRKPCYAFTPGSMDSAAYYVGCAADKIFAFPSADAGSIGVYVPVVDESVAYAMAGYKVDMITSGPLKGMGYPGTQLTPEQRQHLQNRVNDIASEFKSFVSMARGEVPADAFSGASFGAMKAKELGLIDEVVMSREDVIERMLAEVYGVNRL